MNKISKVFVSFFVFILILNCLAPLVKAFNDSIYNSSALNLEQAPAESVSGSVLHNSSSGSQENSEKTSNGSTSISSIYNDLPESQLGLGNVLNILLIVVGVLLILLGIAILIRLNN